MHYTFMDSPYGKLLLSGADGQLGLLAFWEAQQSLYESALSSWAEKAAPFLQAIRQLDEYFSGSRQSFDLPLRIQGTDFQQRVYAALRRIPYGEVCTYGDVAQTIGQPKAVRAVGSANNRNQLPIIVPCHRVIGRQGKLVGYSAGLDVKKRLLQQEGVDCP